MIKLKYNFWGKWILGGTFILTLIIGHNWRLLFESISRVVPELLNYYWLVYIILISLWFIGLYFSIKAQVTQE